MKTTKKSKKRKYIPKIDILQTLYTTRQVFLTDVINERSSRQVMLELRALSRLSPKPILLHINSRGGYVQEGLAILDTMRTVAAPIITVVTGIAASMAGIISITGVQRLMTKNSVWMAHNCYGGVYDYLEKVYDKVEYLKQMEKQIFEIFRNRTKLTERELTKSRHGELWLFADEAKKKGIVDIII